MGFLDWVFVQFLCRLTLHFVMYLPRHLNFGFCAGVQVALRLNTSSGSGGRKLRSGDAVVYVVCDDGSSLPATQRAYHPDLEVAKRPELSIDARYYLEHQVHPVVSRLCDPIEGV